MRRRSFFAALLSFLGFGLAPAIASEPKVRKVFRQSPTKEGPFWEEIAWDDMRPGDQILCVGDIIEIWAIEGMPCGIIVKASLVKKLQA